MDTMELEPLQQEEKWTLLEELKTLYERSQMLSGQLTDSGSSTKLTHTMDNLLKKIKTMQDFVENSETVSLSQSDQLQQILSGSATPPSSEYQQESDVPVLSDNSQSESSTSGQELSEVQVQNAYQLAAKAKCEAAAEADRLFLKVVEERERKKKPGAGVEMQCYCLSHPEELEQFVSDYLEELQTSGQGVFTKLKLQKGIQQYRCVRSAKSVARKIDPMVTLRINCPAYVSFKKVAFNGRHAVVVRKKTHHDEHDPTDMEERRISPVDPSVRQYIEDLSSQGMKNCKILVECAKMAREKGFTDFRDRQYYPSPIDVKNIVAAFKARQRLHNDDSVAVDLLCSQLMKERVAFYQALDETKRQDLIIVYQNAEQRERMKKFGDTVFLDATYKGMTAYGYAFYCLLARDARGQGTPLAYFILSADTTEALETALLQLTQHAAHHGIVFSPRSFMVDRDLKEIAAIQRAFPKSDVLLCWFHVLQAVYRWLNSAVSGIHGPHNADKRREVVDYLRAMKSCTTEDAYNDLVVGLDDKMPNRHISEYLQKNWVTRGKMWANFGRRYHHQDQETNNLVERFFLGMKYNHLRGFGNQRVEDLLLLLDGDVSSFYNYMDGLLKAGRISSKLTARSNDGKEKAASMMLQGWERLVRWETDDYTKCFVPSQQNQNHTYAVDLLNCTCQCIAAPRKGMCKHVHVGLIIASSRGIDMEAKRQERALWLFDRGSFYNNVDEVEVLDIGGTVGVVNKQTMFCLCIANSHGIRCVCQRVAKLVMHSLNMPSTQEDKATDQPAEQEKEPKSHLSELDKLDKIRAIVLRKEDKLSVIEKKKINELYLIMTGSFKKRGFKRKQRSESSNPQRLVGNVKRTKKTKQGMDHGYSSTTMRPKLVRKDKCIDGASKFKNRSMGSLRKSFSK